MTYYIKTTRDTLTGRVTVHPPEPAPDYLEPYRLRYTKYMAECVQVYPSFYEANNRYADEKLYESYCNMTNENRRTELKKLSKKLTELNFNVHQISKITGVKRPSLIAYRRGAVSVNPRFLARLRLFVDELTALHANLKRRLPDSGDCGNASKGRGGNPKIQKYANSK